MIVQFFEWGNPESVASSMSDVKIGDRVVVQHKWGLLIGEVISNGDGGGNDVVGQVIRKAMAQDFEVALKNKQKECLLKKEIKKSVRDIGLGMKVVEVQLSIDGGCVIAIFTADSRVDFRDLVKNISAELGKSVRFQQVGSRDEAKKIGGFGICGRELCCCKFSRGLKSITTDMARCQMIAHRGSERLSGLCGRLMCCLSYESKQYEKLGEDMPIKGDKIIYDNNEVDVVDTLILEQKIKVLLSDGKYKMVNMDEVKIIK